MNSRRHRCSLVFLCVWLWLMATAMAGAGAWDRHPMLTGFGLCVNLRPCVAESVRSFGGVLA